MFCGQDQSKNTDLVKETIILLSEFLCLISNQTENILEQIMEYQIFSSNGFTLSVSKPHDNE